MLLFKPSITYKAKLSLVIGGILFFYGWLVFAATHVPLPSAQNPIHFYSNQTRHDIKQVYFQALEKANESIFLSVYGVTDTDILSTLTHQAEKKIPITVQYDPSASSNLKKLLPSSISLQPIKAKGLMHRKIVSLNHAHVYLGSANLTESSLRHHDNLVLGIYDPKLAAFIENPTGTYFSFPLQGQKGELFLLPDSEQLGFKRLIHELQQAKSSIAIAMFTLTHPQIADVLIAAKNRGIVVSIIADYYTAKGASKKTLQRLTEAGVHILSSQGRQLLHHKWALIDKETFILGSANWTKAAFTKNHDFLLFLSPLTSQQKKFLHNLWDVLLTESTPLSLER